MPRSRMIPIAAAASLLLAPGAHAAAPLVTSIIPGRAVTAVTFVGYDPAGSYDLEISRRPALEDGHFARPVAAVRRLTLRSDLTRTVRFDDLAPGRYYARAAHDYTAAHRALWKRLCKLYGCTSPPDGTRVLEWSHTVEFTVPEASRA